MDKLCFSTTFETFTPESLEHGESESHGFEDESWQPDDFEELLRFLEREGFIHWSSSHPGSANDWLSTEPYTISYERGETKSLSIHANNERSFRYLIKAADMLNIQRSNKGV